MEGFAFQKAAQQGENSAFSAFWSHDLQAAFVKGVAEIEDGLPLGSDAEGADGDVGLLGLDFIDCLRDGWAKFQLKLESGLLGHLAPEVNAIPRNPPIIARDDKRLNRFGENLQLFPGGHSFRRSGVLSKGHRVECQEDIQQ